MTVELEEQLFNLINNGSLQEIKDFYNNNPSVAHSEWVCTMQHTSRQQKKTIQMWVFVPHLEWFYTGKFSTEKRVRCAFAWVILPK